MRILVPAILWGMFSFADENNVPGQFGEAFAVAIQGTVLDSVMNPVPNVQIQLTGDTTGAVWTDEFGEFALMVDSGWSGKLTPFRSFTVFTPGSETFTNLTANANVTFTAWDWCASSEILLFSDILTAISVWGSDVMVIDDLHFDNNDDGVSDIIDILTFLCRYPNQDPSFTAGSDVTILEDSGPYAQPWATDLDDGDGGLQQLAFGLLETMRKGATLYSDYPWITPDGTLMFTSADDANGSSSLDVRLFDNWGGFSPISTFTLTIMPVNDPPTFISGVNITYNGPPTIQTESAWATDIQPGAENESSQTLMFNILNNTMPTLFSSGPVVDATTGDLTFTPANGANGTATISLNLTDDGGTANGGNDASETAMFDISVTSLNHEPSFSAGGNDTVLEDSGAQTVSAWATNIDDGDGGSQTLTFHVTNDDNALFSVQPDVDESTGNLTYLPATNAFGVANVSVALMDDGGTAGGGDDTSPTAMLTITVTSVNDEPSFVVGADQTVAEDAGAQTAVAWAAAISPGNAFESGQALSFQISNNNNGLFSVQPDVDESTGNLTYTPAPNASGSATVTINLSDDGGTANGGDDQSPDQTFAINVTEVDDPPIAVDDSYATIGNMLLEVGATPTGSPAVRVSGNLLDNDSDVDSSISVQSPGISTTTQSGSVTTNSDGTFTYSPPPGFSGGNDSFMYTITDGVNIDSATVTITISNDLAWFVDNTAAAGGDGTSASPFSHMADLNAAAIETGDTIFIFEGSTTTPGNELDGGLTLLDHVTLQGEAAALQFIDPNDSTPKTFVSAGNAPVITDSAGNDVITLGSENTIRGLKIVPQSTRAGIFGNGSGGTITIDNIEINPGATADGIVLSSQSGTFNLSNTSMTGAPSSGVGLFVTSSSATFNVDGLTCTSLDGIDLNNNDGADFNFTNTTSFSGPGRAAILNGNPNCSVDFATLTITNPSIVGLDIDSAGLATDQSISITSCSVSGGTSGTVFDVDNHNGILSIAGGTISHTGGPVFDLDNVIHGGTLETGITSVDAGPSGGVKLNACSGTFAFGSVNINNSAGPGVSIVNSGGGSFTFDEGLNLVTTNGTGFSANTAGELNITSGSVNATSAGAVNLTNTVIGNQGVTWTSLASANAPGTGLTLNTVSDLGGASAFFSVSGTTAVNMAVSHGISVSNCSTDVSLNHIDIDNTGQDGLALSNNSGSVTVSDGDISGASSDGVYVNQGNALVTLGCTIGNGTEYAVTVQNRTGGIVTFDKTITDIGGRGIQLTNNSSGNPVVNFNALTMLNTGSNTAIRSSSNTGATVNFASVDLDTTTGTALDISGTGTFNLSQGTLNTTNGVGMNISNSNLGVTLTSVSVANGSGNGIVLTSNTGSTTLNSLGITNTGGTGLSATNAGTVSIAGSTNGIATTSGTAVSMTNTTIGGDGATGGINLQSVSSSNAANGIYLDTTGVGRFVVTGTGSPGSGGTIQTITNNGVELRSCQNVWLSYMNLTHANTTDNCGTEAYDETGSENCRAAIYMNDLRHVTLSNIAIFETAEQGINGVDVTHFRMYDSTITNAGDSISESGILIRDLLGTSADANTNIISGCTITNAAQVGVFIRNLKRTNAQSGQADRLEITNTTVTQSGDIVAADNITISLRDDASSNGSNMQVVVSGCTLTGVNGEITDAIQLDSGINAKGDFQITNTQTNHCNTGINISAADNSTTTFDVYDNTSINVDGGQGISIACNGTAVMTGSMTGNTIDSFNANNPGFGIDIVVDATGSATVDVDNNNVTDFSIPIRAGARNSGAGSADITITNNTMSSGGGFAFGVLWVFSGNSAGQSNSVCATISGNNFNDPFGTQEYYIEQYPGSTLNLQGYAGAATDTAAIEGFIESNNIAGDALVETCCGTSASVGGATCSTPN